ncbi:hypothetical protein B0J18DRAFT_431558, partial [Chaetomium sp. MPI-SDFR-AT-0129]
MVMVMVMGGVWVWLCIRLLYGFNNRRESLWAESVEWNGCWMITKEAEQNHTQEFIHPCKVCLVSCLGAGRGEEGLETSESCSNIQDLPPGRDTPL